MTVQISQFLATLRHYYCHTVGHLAFLTIQNGCLALLTPCKENQEHRVEGLPSRRGLAAGSEGWHGLPLVTSYLGISEEL